VEALKMNEFRMMARPAKANHVEMILYEIDMLQYCLEALREKESSDRREYYLQIEGFLIHYRNLADFFGSDEGLKANRPERWSPRPLSGEELASIQNRVPAERYRGPISEYVCHCSPNRADKDTKWDREAMYELLKPNIESFRKLFPSKFKEPQAAQVTTHSNMSTTSTSVVTIDPSLYLVAEEFKPEMKPKDFKKK
jgi:hypothetical protein